jgi:hypothetical protein
MDNKLFDHIEQQMKTAVDSWEPAFDEKAWEDMEKKLEGENDRKKPVAWWSWLLPLLLLLITGGYFLLGNNTGGDQDDSYGENTASAFTKTISKDIVSDKEKESSDNTAISSPAQKTTYPVPPSHYETPYKSAGTTTGESTKDEEEKFQKNNFTINEKGKMAMKVSGGQTSENENDEIIKEEELSTTDQQKEIVKVPDQDQPLLPEEKKKPASPEKQTEPVPDKKEKQENKKDKQLSKFYFSVAGGIEGNGVDFPGTNKFSTRAGLTIGYQLTKKLSVQTGFFAGSKKYVAGKGDYKANDGYWATVDITKVDADCRVFEIPLNLRYDFSPSAKWNSFAGAGLSSYIMDKEDYAYDYIRFGIPYYATATYKGNRHFLSVIRLYGGVERKISSQFSLGINPGLAIPLAGAGEGQIKLFSTELLLSLKYRPFKRSK